MEEAEEYLDKNLKNICREMLYALLDECPEKPKAFMINWLAKKIGQSFEKCNERVELEKLRKEEEEYINIHEQHKKSIFKKVDFTVKNYENSHNNNTEKSTNFELDNPTKRNSIKNFKRTMTPAIKDNIFKSHNKLEIKKAEIENDFLKNTIKEDLEKSEEEGNEEEISNKEESEDEEEDEDENENVDELINQRKNIIANRGQRASVSAEAYGIFNKKAEFVPKVIPKTNDQRQRIFNKVIQSFLFNSLEENDLNTVIDAMDEKSFKSSVYVIRQGENGSVLYLVESGELDCYKKFVYFL